MAANTITDLRASGGPRSGIEAPELTAEQYNFCRAIDAMKNAAMARGGEPAWLIAHPGEIARVWGETPARLCGLKVSEFGWCSPGSFYVASEEDYRDMMECARDDEFILIRHADNARTPIKEM